MKQKLFVLALCISIVIYGIIQYPVLLDYPAGIFGTLLGIVIGVIKIK